MKTAGMIGGVGPESTIEYYRGIVTEFRKATGEDIYPSLIINSINMARLRDLIAAERRGEAADYLVEELQRLSAAGASFGFIGANAPHLVFAEVLRRSPLPLISIVEVTCAEAKARGLKKLALFGARFTMQAAFYPEVFSKEGIAIVMPMAEEQAWIHEIYLNQLVHGLIRPETRERLLQIAERIRNQDNTDGLILGGTELSLILREESACGIPLLDTTKIHVRAVVTEMLK